MPENIPHELFEQTVRVNLLGLWYCCREVGRVMLSDTARAGPTPGLAAGIGVSRPEEFDQALAEMVPSDLAKRVG